MPIKTGRVRRNFDTALQKKTICDNMLLMGLAYLNDQLSYNGNLKKGGIAKYQLQRSTLAKCALDNGINRDTIKQKINSISRDRFPSDGQIQALTDLIDSNNYSYVRDFIPDTDLIEKSDVELSEMADKKMINRNEIAIQQEQTFIELCSFFEQELLGDKLTNEMISKLKNLSSNEYDYSVVLQCCKWYDDSIKKSVAKKRDTAPFNSLYDKFSYIVAIVKNKLPDTVEGINRNKRADQEFFEGLAKQIIDGDYTLDEMICMQCDSDSVYKGKHELVKNELRAAMKRIRGN